MFSLLRFVRSAAAGAALLIGAATLPHTAAEAQGTGGPSRVQRPAPAAPNSGRPLANEAESQRIMRDFAQCVVQGYRSWVDRFLATAPGSPEAQRLAQRVAFNDCLLIGELRFQEPLLRGGMYEALYQRDYGRVEGPNVSTAPAINYDVRGATRDQVVLRRFADCVARENPAASRALVLSPVGQPSENAAFAALGETLSVCLVPGERAAFSRPILRGIIAEALYRLSQAAAG